MNKHLQTTLLGLSISLILSSFPVNADTQTPKILMLRIKAILIIQLTPRVESITGFCSSPHHPMPLTAPGRKP